MDIENKLKWHSLDAKEVLARLKSSESGLNDEEALKRLGRYGPNTIDLNISETILGILWRQLHNPIVYVLLFSTLLSFSLSKITDSIVVLSVVILNTLIGFIQEFKAHKTIQSLSSLVPDKSTVKRDNEIKSISSNEVVPGDIIILQAGERISADLRLIYIKNLQCDESTLTGESLPVNKITEPIHSEALVSDRKCIAFKGTYVTSGTGCGVVVETGIQTEFGKISKLIEQVSTLDTPLTVTIRNLAKSITYGILTVSFFLFLIGFFRGILILEAAFAAVTLAVAAIPEGLPAIITIGSSIGVRRMARKQAIIRQLPAVEALGSVTMICTDKTGTLTCNEMTVQKIWTHSGLCFVSGVGYSTEGDFSPKSFNREEIDELLLASILCNDASLDLSSKGVIPIGDPTEVALIICGRKFGFNENILREKWKRQDVIPFDSQKKFMATLNYFSNKKYIYIKGAPEEILPKCKIPSQIQEIKNQIDSMANQGMRVLAIAKKHIQGSIQQLNEKEIEQDCTFLGLVGMIDPARREVYQALRACRSAGITVKMVTGDHPLTAEAIGRDLGILENSKVVTGLELNRLSKNEFKQIAHQSHVFARVSPENKLELVKVLQELGHVVAMTGDGVNDAAALKRADIGIAMGMKGTAVAREAADIILTDDNFATLEASIEEGRRTYDNLIKSLTFVLPTSLGQALIIFLAILFFPILKGTVLHPMSPVQILWVNLIVATSLSLPLAFEPAEPNIMSRPPRKKNKPVITNYILIKTLLVASVMAIGSITLFLWEYNIELQNGIEEKLALSKAQTLAVTAIILFQMFYMYNCRSFENSIKMKGFFSNRLIFLGIIIVFISQLIFIYNPLMNHLFNSSKLNFQAWVSSLLVAILIIPIIWIEKLMKNKMNSLN